MKKKVCFIMIFSSLLLLGACTINRKPLFDLDEKGNKVQVKRIATHMTVNYATRFSRSCYIKNEKINYFNLSEDQKFIIDQYGQPDYIRKEFLSTRNDYVREWVFLGKNVLVQFVRGTLIYEGEITDKDMVMILNGYPDKYFLTGFENNIYRESYEYYNTFTGRFDNYHFANGKLIYGQGPK